jgi:alginate O-acetyltransferase complex protein AlgJ
MMMPAPTLPETENSVSFTDKLTVFTLIAVMLFGAWQLLQASFKIDWQAIPHTSLDFQQGRTTNTLEKQLDHLLPARNTLIASANSLRYLLTRSAGEQVRVGREGWLFLTDELRFYPNGTNNLLAHADLIQQTSAALQQLGVQLVVVLVPDKARVYAQYLRTDPAAENQARYQHAIETLQQRGVKTVNLHNILNLNNNIETYYRSDTHWNQFGAQLAANAIAQSVRELKLDLTPATFTTETSGTEMERAGDLIRLMGLANVPNALRPPVDHETLHLTRQTSEDSAGGLFGDVVMPVVLTGTSYSLRGNFHGALQQAMGCKVLNTAKDGGGFLTALTQYLKDDAFISSKPKVLIWELPERFLGEALDNSHWLQDVKLRP